MKIHELELSPYFRPRSATVVGAGVELLTRPGHGGAPIGELRNGDQVRVSAVNFHALAFKDEPWAPWYIVETSGGLRGWCSGQYLDVHGTKSSNLQGYYLLWPSSDFEPYSDGDPFRFLRGIYHITESNEGWLIERSEIRGRRLVVTDRITQPIRLSSPNILAFGLETQGVAMHFFDDCTIGTVNPVYQGLGAVDDVEYRRLPEEEVAAYQPGSMGLEIRDEYGRTALGRAAAHGSPGQIRQLVADGAELESRLPDAGETPLMLAIRSGSLERSTTLLEVGANPNVFSSRGQDSPLSIAVEQGQRSLVELLLRHDANPNYPSVYAAQTPLSVAVSKADAELAELLLHAGARVHYLSFTGKPVSLIDAAPDPVVKALLTKYSSTTPPNVTPSKLSIECTSQPGACGTGDSITFRWDNSPRGDANKDITEGSQALFDLSAFGLPWLMSATDVEGGIFSYKLVVTPSMNSGQTLYFGLVAIGKGGATGPVFSDAAVTLSASQ